MSSAAWALARSVWWPYRRGLAVCAAVWLVLAALGLLMPRGAWGPAAPENAPIAPVATVVVGLFLLAFPFMLYAFSAIPIEAPIDARDTAFPTRTFTLPVATAILVAVPMFQGATAAAAVWVAWAGAVLRPAGMKVDLVWSAVLTAALVAWLQALVWWPFPLRFLRIIVAAPVIAAIAWAPAFTLALGAPPIAVAAALVALLPAAYGVAVVGVARARRGDVPTWTWPSRLAGAFARSLPSRHAPFSSPLRAQTWFEWRMRGMGFPCMVGPVAVVWMLVVLTGAGEQALATLAVADAPHGAAAAITALTAPGLLLAVLLAVVPLLAAVAGLELGGVRTVDFKQPSGPSGCHPFLALRPLTEGALVLAKLRMALRATLTGWALALLAAFLGLGLSGKWREVAGAPLFQTHSAWEVAAGLAAGCAGLLLLTWLGLVVNLWIGLTGRRWLINAFGAVPVGVFVALALLASWLSSHAQVPAALAALPYVLAAAVVLKLLLACGLARVLWRRGLMHPAALAAAAAVWVVAVVGAVAVLGWLASDRVSFATVVLGVVLFLPLNRFAAAPLALAWNRHR